MRPPIRLWRRHKVPPMGFPLSIEGFSSAESKVLSSRFIALLSPCEDEASFAAFLQKARKDYPKAAHYCYAFRTKGFEGFSDDGEPPRSVGLPFLNLLREKGLRRVCLVAIRYFGGTKLGLGRLKRVYLGVAEASIAKASLLEIVPACRLRLESPYDSYMKVRSEALSRGYSFTDEVFSSSVKFSLLLDARLVGSFAEALPPEVSVVGKDDGWEILRRAEHDTQRRIRE